MQNFGQKRKQRNKRNNHLHPSDVLYYMRRVERFCLYLGEKAKKTHGALTASALCDILNPRTEKKGQSS
jgi:hypothetical protein